MLQLLLLYKINPRDNNLNFCGWLFEMQRGEVRIRNIKFNGTTRQRDTEHEILSKKNIRFNSTTLVPIRHKSVGWTYILRIFYICGILKKFYIFNFYLLHM